MAKTSYTGADIKDLPYPENVRLRPEMYIGPTDINGQCTCIREIVNNSVDEFLAGHCNEITLTRYASHNFDCTDNGRGVPFDLQENGDNTLLKVFGTLHAGRNFEAKEFYSTGLNGVGSSVVNALSSLFVVTSKRGNDYGTITFKKGTDHNVLVKKLKNPSEIKIKTKTGTSVNFIFDTTLFEGEVTDEMLQYYLHEVAYLNTGLKINYVNAIKGNVTKTTYHYTTENHGIPNYIKDVTKLLETEKSKVFFDPVFFTDTIDNTKIEIAFTYITENRDETVLSFCNTINTVDGGTHVTGFKRSFTQNILEYIKVNKLSKIPLESDDLKSGLVVLVSVFTFNPKYTSQTKTKLANTEISGHVIKACNKGIKDWLEKNGKLVKVLAELFILNAKGRIAQKKALDQVKKDSSSFMSAMNDVSKYAPCIESGPHCELFIVEGKSGKGSTEQGRCKNTQAVYAVKGKPLNLIITEDSKIFGNNEVADIITILKCGTKDNVNLEKIPFGKIIILSDADIDGSHIAILLMTLCNELFRALVEAGMLYIAVTPLYRATKVGKAPVYLKDDIELSKFYLKEIETNFKIDITNKDKKKFNKERLILLLKKYCKEVKDLALRYSTTPEIFEYLLITKFDGTYWEFDETLIVSLDENDLLSINGFVTISNTEVFVSINKVDYDTLVLDINELLNSTYLTVLEFDYSITYKANPFEKDTKYEEYNVMEKLSQSYNILRMKGLGEANPEELASTTLNPTNRVLIQVTHTILDQSITQSLMSSDAQPKKDFINTAFENKAVLDNLDI